MTAGDSSRRIAYQILSEYGRHGAFLNGLLASRLLESSLDRRDRALVTELVLGTVRMLGALDHFLSRFSSRTLESLDPAVLWILRLSAYQVIYTDVPDYAACDTATRLARSEAGGPAAGFVNGVIRALVRGAADVPWPDRDAEPISYLCARYSLPEWIAETWIEELGFKRAESLCAACNVQPGLSLRCNLARTTRKGVEAALEAEGIETSHGHLAPESLLVKGSGLVTELDVYRQGKVSVQDEGSTVVGHLVDPSPGMRIADLCAAPGGKANHIAELMKNQGSVLAVDISAARLAMVKESARRLGNTIIEARALDATGELSKTLGEFDRVLVDAPCSGLGTLARRPDARWRRDRVDVGRLSRLQRSILLRGAELVRTGGLLVYSTCTISREENRGVVDAFLQSAPMFEPATISPAGRSAVDGYIQLFPDSDGCDGMFAAVMRRIG